MILFCIRSSTVDDLSGGASPSTYCNASQAKHIQVTCHIIIVHVLSLTHITPQIMLLGCYQYFHWRWRNWSTSTLTRKSDDLVEVKYVKVVWRSMLTTIICTTTSTKGGNLQGRNCWRKDEFSSVWWQAIELSYSLCWNKTQEHAQAHW
jgi:hypothetical protein